MTENSNHAPVAPVSPDATGKCGELVTVGYMVSHEEGLGAVEEPLVTRSQALELLAAERAESDRLAGIASEQMARAEKAEADNAAKDAEWQVAAKLGSEVNRNLAQQVVSLDAKLMAAEARVKELEEAIDRSEGDYWRFLHNQCLELGKAHTALEAKLTAAEKALGPFADIADLIDAETEGMAETDELIIHFHDYEFAKWPVSLFRKARAALGGKP